MKFKKTNIIAYGGSIVLPNDSYDKDSIELGIVKPKQSTYRWILLQRTGTSVIAINAEPTIAGVYWAPWETGLPNTVVETLDFPSNNTMVAFTYGRGAFAARLRPRRTSP